jgi:hypothetical protein
MLILKNHEIKRNIWVKDEVKIVGEKKYEVKRKTSKGTISVKRNLR